jgi:hypothetical protein
MTICDAPTCEAQASSASLDCKRQGELAELAFLHKAAAFGLTVSKPFGESAHYDFVVECCARLLRVQIKSASARCRGYRPGSYRIATTSGHSRKHAYTPEDIDLLAAYIIPEDTWYLIPVRAFFPRKTIRLCPCRATGPFEQFHEAWHLLTQP